MTNLKGLYTDWVWLQKQTGCGRDANGEVTATADWWAKEIKVFEVIVFFILILQHLFFLLMILEQHNRCSYCFFLVMIL
jgi:hypothetical protein